MYSSERNSSVDLNTGLFRYPFRLLYHHKDSLEEYATAGNPGHSPGRNEETARHVKHLIDYLYAQKGIRLADLELSWNLDTPVVAYRDLWLLFKPGTDVYLRNNDGSLEMYVLDGLDGPVPSESGVDEYSPSCSLSMWNLDYDGAVIGRSKRTRRIGFYEGERPITSLIVYPRQYHVNDTTTPKADTSLLARGKKFVELCKKPVLREYTGESEFYGSKKYIRQRVMTDHESRPWTLKQLLEYRPSIPLEDDDPPLQEIPPPPPPHVLYNSGLAKSSAIGSKALMKGCRCDECRLVEEPGSTLFKIRVPFSNYDNIESVDEHEWSDHQYMLCCSGFYAFVLKDRKWDYVSVDGLKEPQFVENAIENLVMAEETKHMIKAVCKTYLQRMSGKQFFTADFIEGKGEGQIFLLHGPPGTGKTLTAECVAEYTRRPLLSITAGDLGDEPYELERRLLDFFRHGSDWDAVVLLDEADIFLHDRGDDDLKRNSIVSVFLRALDYFEGILFLTTNRVGVIDEAFKSRIHLQLGFSALNNEARDRIWANNFKRLQQAEIPIVPDWQLTSYVQESPDVQELKLNGREIRNAFQTAVALAMDDDVRDNEKRAILTPKHLSDVMKMVKEFRKYMITTQKGPDEKIAQLRGHRAADVQR